MFPGNSAEAALWNAFFNNVAIPAQWNEETVAMFAYVLNVFKIFAAAVPNDSIIAHMDITLKHIHLWGERETECRSIRSKSVLR